jgi:hypothetical protein
MPACPTCGQSYKDAGTGGCPSCRIDSAIVAWLAPGSDGDGGGPRGEESVCLTCGYAGEMDCEGGLPTCPACRAVLPSVRVSRIIRCEGCGQAIGISEEDRGRTIICPHCQYFLGCVLRAEGPRGQRKGP